MSIETPPYPLNLVVVEGRDWPALAAVVLEQVHGPKAISSSEAMAQAYSGLRSERSGEQTSVRMRKRLFRLDRVNPPSRPCPGALRPATSADTAQLIDWSYRFYVDIADSRAELGPPTQLSDRVQFFLWEEQGTIRSMAAIARATSRGATLSYVYTPPEWRGRGYAGHLVAALSQHILDSGKEFAALYTDLANPTSNKIYAEVGYRPVADYQVVAFEAGEERKGS
ncbi:MAG: GNAT family N-acetyltransferase [Planctomycetota bacterium]